MILGLTGRNGWHKHHAHENKFISLIIAVRIHQAYPILIQQLLGSLMMRD